MECDKLTFIYTNPNPVGRKTTDCVIRSLSIAFDKSWDMVFDELVRLAQKMKCTPTSKEVYEEYLSNYPTMDVFYMKGKSKKRLKVKEVINSKMCICRVAHHLVACKGGDYFDTFDSGEKCLYKIWRVE